MMRQDIKSRWGMLILYNLNDITKARPVIRTPSRRREISFHRPGYELERGN